VGRQRGAGGLVRAGDGRRPSSVVRRRRSVGPGACSARGECGAPGVAL
jgi:hypothetical protein